MPTYSFLVPFLCQPYSLLCHLCLPRLLCLPIVFYVTYAYLDSYAYLITVVNGRLDRHGCLSGTCVDKLRLLETLKNKLLHARRRSYHIEQV